MQPWPTTLVGTSVVLEPLREAHAAGLLLAADESAFRYMVDRPDPWDIGGFASYIRKLIARPDERCFAIINKADKRVAGITCYLDIRPKHRGVEVGRTWIGEEFRGTRVNPEAKRLMLAHAFETPCLAGAPAVRVGIKTDVRNEQSQRAIAKLGATREGVLRSHMIYPDDGFVRDTVMFSITESEWPAIRERLDARLAAL